MMAEDERDDGNMEINEDGLPDAEESDEEFEDDEEEEESDGFDEFGNPREE